MLFLVGKTVSVYANTARAATYALFAVKESASSIQVCFLSSVSTPIAEEDEIISSLLVDCVHCIASQFRVNLTTPDDFVTCD